MIPYVVVETIRVGPLSLQPFGILVSLGVWSGVLRALGRAKQLGISRDTMVEFLFVVVLSGFVGGHVASVAFYFPEHIAGDPWIWLRLWESQSSLGGFVGALGAALLWARLRRTPLLPFAEIVARVLPLGWFFGRLGCSLVHDHPGIRSDAWFAVAFPGGGRLDLGLLEAVFAGLLTLVFLVWERRPRPLGFYSAWLLTLYAPVRFGFDFLRETEQAGGDRRLGPLTFAQYCCLGFALIGALRLRAISGVLPARQRESSLRS